LTVQNLKII